MNSTTESSFLPSLNAQQKSIDKDNYIQTS